MKKKFKNITSFLPINNHIKLDSWNKDVKESINKLLDTYKNKNEYVVFDFDNTSSIFDIEEQLIIYQLETLSFEIKPKDLRKILSTNLSDLEENLSRYGFFKGSYNDLLDDICLAYNNLYSKYNISYLGLTKNELEDAKNNVYYYEFITKMRMMYDLVDTKESSDISYPWLLYWFYGMSKENLYNLSCKSCLKYKDYKSKLVTWESGDIKSKIGKISYTFTEGISVTDNIKELYRALYKNNIDIWICTASASMVIMAAIDIFKLHKYVKGLIGLTLKCDDNNKFTNKYDYNGHGYLTNNNSWIEKENMIVNAQTQAYGKVVGINNVIYPIYNKGPIAGFMDSTGDFNFCSEYNSLKLVVCFNRANRKACDGGGLISILATYQKEYLGYDLNKANQNNDTFYILQGRNENLRILNPSNKTYLVGSNEQILFLNKENFTLLDYFKNNNFTTKEICEIYAIKNDSQFDFKYGFLDSYNGYHNIK